MHVEGEPIHGELHSTDAHSGVSIPVYNQGSLTARTLAAYEYLEITSLEIVSAAGGDIQVFSGTSGSPSAGQMILRGTVAANGGLAMSRMRYTGRIGETLWVVAPAGVVDVLVSGAVRQESVPGRAPYQQSLVPGA